METVVRVKNLSKKYSSGIFTWEERPWALKDVSFSVQKGEVFGIVGESGAGKTTLAKLLMAIEKPTDGSVSVVPAGRGRVQMVFQDPHGSLNPKLLIKSTLAEALGNNGVNRKARISEAVRLIELVGLDASVLKKRPGQLSGGQKQRIALARCLAMKPEVLVLDEPVSSLDVSIQATIVNLLMRLKNELKLSYILISHDLELIKYMSDRVAVLLQGELIETGTLEKMVHHPEHWYTKNLFNS